MANSLASKRAKKQAYGRPIESYFAVCTATNRPSSNSVILLDSDADEDDKDACEDEVGSHNTLVDDNLVPSPVPAGGTDSGEYSNEYCNDGEIPEYEQSFSEFSDKDSGKSDSEHYEFERNRTSSSWGDSSELDGNIASFCQDSSHCSTRY